MNLNENTSFTKDYEKEFLKNKFIRIVKILKELDQTKYSKDVIKRLASLNIEDGSEIFSCKTCC